MRRMAATALSVLALGAMTAAPAQAHPAWFSEATHGLPPTYTGPTDTVTGTSTVPIARQSDNVEFVAHVPIMNASDMQFQRRSGRQLYGGEIIDATVDIMVMGGISDPGLAVFDVTDPTNPVVLTTVSCGGFHSEVALWENLLIQSWDGGGPACAEGEPADPDGLDRAGAGSGFGNEDGVRIFDLTDPTAPRLVKFIGEPEGIPLGVHNVTVHGEAGLLYLNMAELSGTDPLWGYVDLNDPQFAVHTKPIRDISPVAGDGCHDGGFAPSRDLFACAAITISLVWDVSDPRNPVEVGTIPNPAISIHHGARFSADEQYIVLNDEMGGAAVAPGCGAHTTGGVLGAMWYYDATIPQAPILQTSFSTSDFAVHPERPCTSHFYGFTPGNLTTVGWYAAGIEVIDFNGPTEGLAVASEHAYFEPEGSAFWAAYPWNGYVFGSSHDYGLFGADDANPAVGLWVIEVEGIDVFEPLAVDEGNVWGRWTSALPAEAGGEVVAAPVSEPTSEPEPTRAPLPVTGGGLVVGLVGVLAGGLLRRRR